MLNLPCRAELAVVVFQMSGRRLGNLDPLNTLTGRLCPRVQLSALAIAVGISTTIFASAILLTAIKTMMAILIKHHLLPLLILAIR